MAITWDETKRRRTIEDRGLDFADAAKVFAGRTITVPDDRRDYGEERNITAGKLENRFVIVVWTLRDGDRRIISMRYGHADEEAYYQEEMDRSR
ncbi:MAG TPA: BrnT family toxin [Stellaceae bacterium]|nr:BrnT family toxin [Stellaceae bacterium]